jgi:hypothetical protein
LNEKSDGDTEHKGKSQTNEHREHASHLVISFLGQTLDLSVRLIIQSRKYDRNSQLANPAAHDFRFLMYSYVTVGIPLLGWPERYGSTCAD